MSSQGVHFGQLGMLLQSGISGVIPAGMNLPEGYEFAEQLEFTESTFQICSWRTQANSL